MTNQPLLRLAHSPDSDDLVMWWPLVGMRGPDGAAVEGELGRPRVDTEGLRFALVAEDVEALNRLAEGSDDGTERRSDGGGRGFDVTAMSAAAYARVADAWVVTRCGGSFGEGYGPKVVVREASAIREPGALVGKRIAVPGRRTSAFCALSMMLGQGDRGSAIGDRGAAFEAVEMVFDQVPGAVVEGRAQAGLLIHEAQLTFASLGLRAVADLGQWWTGWTGLPLPLGLNVVRRDLDARHGAGTVARVARVLMRSVRYAVEHGEESRRYLLMHSEGRPEWRDAGLVDRYLSMYVSRLSVDMGERGEAALGRFFGEASARGLLPAARVEVV